MQYADNLTVRNDLYQVWNRNDKLFSKLMACRQFPKCYSLDLKEFGVPIPEDVSDVDSAYRRGHMQYHAPYPIIFSKHLTQTGDRILPNSLI